MIKILHIFPTYKLGGGPICVLRLIESSNHEFEHYTAAKLKDKVLYDQFIKQTQASFDINLLQISVKSIIQLRKIIKRKKPDILHAHGKGAAFYGFILAILMLKPFKLVYTFHGFHQKWYGYKWKVYLFFEFLNSLISDKLIAVSNSEKEYYLSTTKVNPSKVEIIHNGIAIQKDILPKKIASVTSRYHTNIVSLSRISHQKDIETMLMAFEKINDVNIALHIIGGYLESDQKYKIEIDLLLSKLKMKDHIYLWGDVSSAGNLIHHFNIYWSTAIYEGLPTSIIEAFLSRTLVVASNCRGNIDLVNEESGYVTQMKNIQNNYEVISKVIYESTKEEKLKIIDKAFDIGQRFTILNYSKNIANLYYRLKKNDT